MKKKPDKNSPLFRLRESLGGVSIPSLAMHLNISYPLLWGIEKGNYRILPDKFVENLTDKIGSQRVEVFKDEYYKFIDSLKDLDWSKASI
jgi:hypothetical protein